MAKHAALAVKTAPGMQAWAIGGTLLVALGVRLLEFRGLYGSDDAIYSIRALEVAAGLWLPSDYIGALRYGINLPVAAFVTVFGRNEWALAGWGLTCSMAELLLVCIFAHRAWGTRAAVFAGLVLAFIPLHIDAATGLIADAPFSAFFTLAAVLVYSGVTSNQRLTLFWPASPVERRAG